MPKSKIKVCGRVLDLVEEIPRRSGRFYVNGREVEPGIFSGIFPVEIENIDPGANLSWEQIAGTGTKFVAKQVPEIIRRANGYRVISLEHHFVKEPLLRDVRRFPRESITKREWYEIAVCFCKYVPLPSR